MKASTLSICRAAAAGGYAVPAINVFDEYSMRSAVAAAVATRSPIIIQISVKTVKLLGVGLVTAMFEQIAGPVDVPVALNLDHCPDRAVIIDVVEAGWSSVLFDASDRDLAAAEQETSEVVEFAHAHGVDVESEIENIVGVEDGVGSDEAVHSYTVQQLADVAERTGADLLAPQVGTAHGLYTARPHLLPERIKELCRLTDRPVVLHGGTGLTEKQFLSFIAAGASKINISTACKQIYMKTGLTHLKGCEQTGVWEPTKYFAEIEAAVVDELSTFPRMFGSAGKADA